MLPKETKRRCYIAITLSMTSAKHVAPGTAKVKCLRITTIFPIIYMYIEFFRNLPYANLCILEREIRDTAIYEPRSEKTGLRGF